ncbi:AAA family ATPase [Rhodococcus sp. SORGH_AS_0301]|uniref:AAA family ATPase n=1 Tax=Rhodococcus sp. SORGH_AS_0301 TaxID=3041780 RepID=UPI0027834CED|nr:ATP-binding protein [Rhodococcus sp. SORGH_AS_0301]MDQ1182033.1 putative ATPase [Rhodococcus sp. SORGH_AS_0301]
MYLRELYVSNNGPLERLHIEFQGGDCPVPCVIVGANGSGKTNLLSIVADALMHGASQAFSDVLRSNGISNSFFRVVGGRTIRQGTGATFSILRFDAEEAADSIFYRENAGDVTTYQATDVLPQSLHSGATWSGTSSSKVITFDDSKAEEIFKSGVYMYSPSSRSEKPHWFNAGALLADTYKTSDRFSTDLDRPLFVEQGLDAFAQWLLGVITESRLRVTQADFVSDDQKQISVQMDASEYMSTQYPLLMADHILQAVLDETTAKFRWAGRHNARKIGVEVHGEPLISGLDSLSGGQATLLSLFGTILRYGDEIGKSPTNIEGIVVIDELDAHMHVDLQMRALPRLISLFPGVQFIISSHSPFFTLGMENQFTADKMQVIEMPHGLQINAEAYSEFETALTAFRETKRYALDIMEEVRSSERPLVLLAGETDQKYFAKAAQVLNYPHLINHFEWVGRANPANGGGTFTGDDSLDRTVQFFEANPTFTQRPIVILYDCDAKVKEKKFESIEVMQLPQVENAVCTKGVENLLPAEVFTDNMYIKREKDTGVGRPTVVHELKKMALCDLLCGAETDAHVFENFLPILARIDQALTPKDESAEANTLSTTTGDELLT